MHKSQKKKKSRDKRHTHHGSQSKSHQIQNAEEKNPDLEKQEAFQDNTGVYKIRHSDIMGRYIVASQNLEPGTIIVREKPLAVGPALDSPVICLGCYYNLEKDENLTPYKCPGCDWPLCGVGCIGINHDYGHTAAECKLLQQIPKNRIITASSARSCYSAIVPLRCLLLKETNPAAYRALMCMEAHNVIRRKISAVWNYNQKNVVDRIVRDWGFVQFEEEIIHTICGILEVNAFEVGRHGISIRAVYPTAFLFSHDCVPNTTHTDEDTHFRLTVRAAKNIITDQIITLSYAYTLQGTLKRREHLVESKFFACSCDRCSDSTELGTNVSTLLCPRCGPGLVLPIAPLDSESPWKCNNTTGDCPGYTISVSTVRLLMEKIAEEVESIDGNDIEGFESFLQRYRNVLHPNNYHCLSVKHSLSQLYGKIDGYLIHELSADLLKRKQDICREILKVFNVLEPGYSRLRGVTLYELHAPIMIQLTRDFQTKNITKGALREQLQEVVKYLKEAAVILGFEPENSEEEIMANAAKDALQKIRDWEKVLGRVL